MGIECDLHHRHNGERRDRTQPHKHKKTTTTKQHTNETVVHRCVTAKIKEILSKKAKQKHNGAQNVVNDVLLGGRDMRATVMPLRSCGYPVMLTSLRESFMEERREKWRGARERDKNRRQRNIKGICSFCIQIVNIFNEKKLSTLPNFTIK